MRPTAIVLGFLLGSAAAITFALAGTAIVFALLRADHPRLDAELDELLRNVLMFAVVTAAAAASFYGEVRSRRWRAAARLAVVVALAGVVAYHATR